MPGANELINDLSRLPDIVGNLGLSIAGAQKAFNVDYLQNVLAYIEIAQQVAKGAGTETKLDIMKKLLAEVAPSRYQFTETELSFRADLSQTLNVGGQLAVGAGLGAVSVNASLAVAFGYDYEAAARVSTVLHAIPAKDGVMASLLGRAEKLKAVTMKLPESKSFDQTIDLLKEIGKSLPDADGAGGGGNGDGGGNGGG